jgi:metallo-beta-lactamase family protein
VTSATFVGACGTVTGSCTLLELGATRLLVDCGLYQGDDELEARNRRRFPFEPAEIDAVLLTHAHLDHVGLLPRLVAEGFRGPIFCTKPTRGLASIVLEDAGEIQEEEARYAARKGYSRHAEPRPLFTARDAREAARRLEPLAFHEDHRPLPGIRFRFVRAGHLLGAASILIEAKDRHGARKRWCFSGDVGRWDVPILVDPEPPGEPVDTLVLESTYGDRRHPASDPLAELDAVVARTFARGGVVLVPAFALGRSQDFLYHLAALVERGRLDPDQVWLDSPMALEATQVYRHGGSEYDEELTDLVRAGRSPFQPAAFRGARTGAESKALNDLDRPAVIVASSGMATAGRIVHHLKRRLPDPRTTVLFVGYQGVGTRGRALVEGAQTVSIHGLPIEVRAEIVHLSGFSAHADSAELLRWCRALESPPERVFLNHGEDPPRKALAASIEATGWPRPALPLPGATVEW